MAGDGWRRERHVGPGRAVPDDSRLGCRVAPSTVSLSASATDAERDPLSYQWSVTSQPGGASVSLTTPGSATTAATGLTAAGQYVFSIAISDSTHTVTRSVALNVYAESQPPFPLDIHNRLPVPVTLPTSNTQLRCAAVDLEGDPLTYRWSVLSQPAGGNAALADPQSAATDVGSLTVPGDYVFRFEASDGTNTVSETLTVPVYPVNHAR